MVKNSLGRVLVTGATGYVGGRLVPRLLEEGFTVRCLVRTPAKLANAPWRDNVEIVEGSLEGPLDVAMANIDTLVYLVHGIGQGPQWAEQEIRDARHVRLAAEAAGVGRVVYLGGLGDDRQGLSVHLASRHAVGQELAAGTIPVVELRAAVIIGSGSASFEMLRYLVDVLPIMVTPRWVTTKSQPIAISDVLHYLVHAIAKPDVDAGVYEIGGPDVLSYAELMDVYAQEAGLPRRRLIPVPFLTPRLSSHWVGLVTPVPASLARPLVDSLVNEVVLHDDRAAAAFGPPRRSVREAIRLALGRSLTGDVPTSFSTADLRVFRAYVTDPAWAGGTVLRDVRTRQVAATPDQVFAAFCRIGGSTGWYAGEWLWRIRGLIDVVIGGPGLRRGRRDPQHLRAGDFVDFWRVEDVVVDTSLRLRAEMLLPGEAWLEWRVESVDGQSRLTQTASFKPKGLLGRLYWYAVAPFHVFVFPGLIRGIARDAREHA